MQGLENYIFRYLDNPLRIITFTVAEIGFPFATILIFYIFGSPLIGVLIGLSIGYGIRKWNESFGPGAITRAAYWYSYVPSKKSSIMPPSYIREYLG